MDGTALNWPALQRDAEFPTRISFEQGVWGKVHGASSDFRWITTTPAFAGARNHIERELSLGSEDAATQSTFWRALGDTCYTAGFYPSRAVDAAGRTGFLEKQILEWQRPAGVPAALGALLLLPVAARLDDTNWWEKHSDVHWDDQAALPLAAAPPLQASMASIAQAIAEGLRLLAESTSEDALTELYAAILAGGRAVPLKGLSAPLPATALAALLLPLPRSVADRLSIAGWLPSKRPSDDAGRCWDVILGGAAPWPGGDSVAPTADQLRDARTMAKAVLAGIPGDLGAGAVQDVDVKPFDIALWGPSAAGKTAFVAKLYIDAEGDENWDVFPTARSLRFIKDMRELMRTKSQFPNATAFGNVEGIEYVFTHRKTGIRSLLQLEDRAGKESEELDDEAKAGKVSLKKRLTSAGGLVLMFDPMSDEAVLEARVSDTLELLNVARGRVGRKEERPIAVCVSKADTLIETPADYRRAIEAPDEFVRERKHVSRALVRAFDRYCTNYRLFPVSAAGVRLRHGVIEPAVFIDERLESRICPEGRPLNLMAPFSWILGQLMGSRA